MTRVRVGLPGSAITDVSGVQVGHFTHDARPTGCTVVLLTEGAVAGVDVRGAAPGTRETDLLDPSNLVQQVHAVLLSGGSAFGLDAAAGGDAMARRTRDRLPRRAVAGAYCARRRAV